jgi:hypothetical protein
LRLIATLGVRRGGQGEALVALALPEGEVLFGLDRGVARIDPMGVAVGGFGAVWTPTRLHFEGYLASHEASDFPPAPLPLLLAPRTVAVAVDLTFAPSTAAIDFCASLSEDQRRLVEPLGRHHVEQAGCWSGTVSVGGRSMAFDGDGGRDHSWGRRDWNALDHSRLFTVRFGDDLALHALALSVHGRRVEGGFLWRDGRAEGIRRVEWAPDGRGAAMKSFELEITTARAERLQLRGVVERSVPVPVALERRPWRLACGRPYALLLHEGFARYELASRRGVGMVEVSERPR